MQVLLVGHLNNGLAENNKRIFLTAIWPVEAPYAVKHDWGHAGVDTLETGELSFRRVESPKLCLRGSFETKQGVADLDLGKGSQKGFRSHQGPKSNLSHGNWIRFKNRVCLVDFFRST